MVKAVAISSTAILNTYTQMNEKSIVELPLYFDKANKLLVFFDKQKGIVYDFSNLSPSVAVEGDLMPCVTPVPRLSRLLLKWRLPFVSVALVFLALWFMRPPSSVVFNADKVSAIQTAISNYCVSNNTSFTPWRCCEIVKQCINADTNDYPVIISNNAVK